MKFSKQDRAVLRELATRVADIAAEPEQGATETEWRRLNSLGRGRALVCIADAPWEEMDVNGELVPRTEDPFARSVERRLRALIYRWNHMRTDDVVEPVYRMPIAMAGGAPEADGAAVREGTALEAFKGDDLPGLLGGAGRVGLAAGAVDDELSRRQFDVLNDVFSDILSVEPCGVTEQVFSPWDSLQRQWGQAAVLENAERSPARVRAALDHLYRVQMERLDMSIEAGILSLNNGNTAIAGGGPGFCDELPQRDFNPARIDLKDQWGWTQLPPRGFGLSPEQHLAFAFPHEKRWLERFGLTAYGWGEALAANPSLLAEIPNLRKICLGPGADIGAVVEKLGLNYAYSIRLSAECLAADRWDLDAARDQLIRRIKMPCSNRCPVEVVLEKATTVRGEPRRLWEWARMAMEVVRALGS